MRKDELVKSDQQGARRLARLGFALLALLGLVVATAACGPGARDTDRCADVICEYGVCDSNTGVCINAETCQVPGQQSRGADAGSADVGTGGATFNKSDCLQGYLCQAGTCEAEMPCVEDAECRSGTCEAGACINPDSCQGDQECVTGYFCGDAGQCVRDQCVGKTCERGVCARRTGQCVNREVCPSPEGEAPACIEGNKCYGGSCYDEEAFCQELTCDRGVCSFADLDCANADSCESDDVCLDGYFCNDGGSCEQNKCDANMVMCDRGVCAPRTGECVNPKSCTASADCLPMNLCVDGACVPQEDACREGGCPGNQVCDYDENTLSASCAENPSAGCTNAVDCTSNRVCKNRKCSPAMACQEDGLEPNNSEAEGTDYFDALKNSADGAVTGNVCSGDVDVFKFDTSKDRNFRGRFVVSVKADPVDVGLGPIKVTLLDPMGNVLEEMTTGENGQVAIDRRFGAGSTGVYTIKVEDAGEVSTAGMRYTMFADIVGKSVVNACANANKLASPDFGNTRRGSSLAVDSSCIANGPDTPENIFELTLEEDSYVDLTVEPSGNADLSASLRRDCPIMQTEEACTNRAGAGGNEHITGTFKKGTYYLIVQPPETGAGGDFKVTYTAESVVCTSADNRCVNAASAKICNERGTQLQDINCNMGCDTQRGVCNRPAGDVCYAAIDATPGLSQHRINFGNLENAFDPGAGSCLGSSMPASDGADSVFKVDLKPNHVLEANLQMDRGADGSLYLARSCGNVASTCIKGIDSPGTRQRLVYANDTQSTETLYLVADSKQGDSGSGILDVAVDPVICKAGSTSCGGKDIKVCNDTGTKQTTKTTCTFGCKKAKCSGDTCAAAFDATGGGSWTFSPKNYNGDYDLGYGSCINDTMSGNDLVFKVDLKAKEVLQATVTEQGSWGNPGIYIVEDCSSISAQKSTCKDGANDSTRAPETVFARAPSDKPVTYYVIVDDDYSTSSGSGQWKLDIKVQQPVCTPGTTKCANSSTLTYCDRTGLNWKNYTCKGQGNSCSTSGGTAGCTKPSGKQCFDPVVVKSGQSYSGSFNGSNNLELPRGKVGNCNVNSDTDGGEHIYQVDLNANDLLRVDLSTNHNYAQMYVLGSCQDQTSCKQFQTARDGGKMYYQTKQAETVFVVIDSYIGRSDTYNATFNITPNAKCIPNSSTCASQNTAAQCDSTGAQYAHTFNCPSGCSNGSCTFTSSGVDKCSAAPMVGNGTVTSIDMDKLSNDITMSNSSCTGDRSPGNDATFKINANPGQTILVNAESQGRGDNPMIYISKTCQAGNSCVAGSDAKPDGQPESLRYTVPAGQGGTYYVHFDAEAGYDSRETWDINIRVASPVCQPGTVFGCNQAGTGISYCAGDGLSKKTYACRGNNKTCSGGRCANPTGGQCFDVVPVKAGDTKKGSFAGTNAIDIKKGTRGNCQIGNRTDGNERIYGISLSANDLLRVNLKTNNNYAQMYVLGRCGQGSTCKQFTSAGNGGDLYFRAKNSGPAYIVIDSNRPSSGSFTATFNVTPNATCIPNRASCVSSNKVAMCNSTGSKYLWGGNCPSGCTAGQCDFKVANADKCNSAPAIGSGTITSFDMSKFSNDVTMSNSSCTGDRSPGNDATLKVTANGGDILTVEADSRGRGDNPMIYISKSCSPTSTCVAGSDRNPDGQPEKVVYSVPQGQGGTYYVHVDAEAGYDSRETWDVTVRSAKPKCKPGTALSCSGPKTLQYCDVWGTTTKTLTCQGQNSPTCQNAACTNPQGDICPDAIDVNSFPATLKMPMGKKSNHINLARTACAGDDSPGYDAIYRVRANAGQTIDINVDSSNGGDNPMAYILSDCAAAARTGSQGCVAGSDSSPDGQPENLRWTVPSNGGGVYYVVVDAEADYDSSGTFTTKINIR